jgi:predicted nucleic acid-binding protein
MILSNTCVWLDHLREGNPVLAELLENARVLMHSFILGELTCGNL